MDIKKFFSKFLPAKRAAGSKWGPSPKLVFTALALIVLLLDVYMIQSAVRSVYKYKFADVGARTVQSTRINFEGYSTAVNRIEDGVNYKPMVFEILNPFGQSTASSQ